MMLFIISIKNRACNTFSEDDFSLGVQTRFRLAAQIVSQLNPYKYTIKSSQNQVLGLEKLHFQFA